MRPILLVLAACAFFAGINLLARLVAETQDQNPISPLQISFLRYLTGAVLLAPLLATRYARWRTQLPLTHVVRSSSGVAAGVCIYVSVAYLPLADVTAITYTSPLFALVLAALFLGERVAGSRWGAVALGLVGVALITRPTPETFQAMAVLALAAAVLIGIETVTLRAIAKRDSTGTAIVYTNGLGLAISSVLIPFVWQEPTAEQFWLCVAIGLVTVSGQVLAVMAMRQGEASLLAPVYYSTLVYAALYGWLAFGEVPALWTWAGAGLIIGSGLWLSRSNTR